MADVTLKNVTKQFGEITAVKDMTLEIADGEFVVLLGPTGAGKTTTLRLVAGLEQADSGSVTIAGQEMTDAPPMVRDVAFVFQQYSLYPHLSVFDNLAFPLRSPARRMAKADIEKRVVEVARLLHIESKLPSKATQLSGGEMQRVAIGRALVRHPSIYLMDEPLSSLDAKLRAEMRLELKRVQRELGATILYVTHDQVEAMTMADRIGVINEGVLIQVAPPREIYERPLSIHVASRLGSPGINLLAPDIIDISGMPAQTATIGARTEHIEIFKADGAPASQPIGKVEWIEHLGDQNHLHVSLGKQRLVTLVDPKADLAKGDEVQVRLNAPLFFDKAGLRIENKKRGAHERSS